MGLVSPITLEPKLLLQTLCGKGLSWDDPLNKGDADRWNNWLGSLSELEQLRIARCLKPEDFGEVAQQELHVFSDASSFAYGSCCYLRLVNQQGKTHCCFVAGKARVAPIKTVTIPRLELTAVVLSVRLETLVKKELGFADCRSVFWTDLTAVLLTIKNSTKRFPVFVANRIAVIDEHTSLQQWNYVPTKLNPADLTSRGVALTKPSDVDIWLNGPSFLRGLETSWPKSPLNDKKRDSDDLLELTTKLHTVGVNLKVQKEKLSLAEVLINYCSSLYRAEKLTAWLIRAKIILLAKVRRVVLPYAKMPLSVEELKDAELELIKSAQQKHFPWLLVGESNPGIPRDRRGFRV